MANAHNTESRPSKNLKHIIIKRIENTEKSSKRYLHKIMVNPGKFENEIRKEIPSIGELNLCSGGLGLRQTA